MYIVRLLSAAALVLAATATTTAAGAQSMKPGLWEITTKMKSSNAELEKAMAEAQKQMAAMPPEQRKMMQDMMAKNGVSMNPGGPGGMSMKVCMTEEMVKQYDAPPPQGDCKTTSAPRAGNTVEMTYACTNPPSTGKGRFTFISKEAYSSQMRTTSATSGKQEQMDIDSAGKWLSADCGNVKPMAAMVPARK